jgi:hypothetical protein
MLAFYAALLKLCVPSKATESSIPSYSATLNKSVCSPTVEALALEAS